MGYPTRADLVAASDEAALTGANATAQDGWYAASKRAVESYCGQRFDFWDEARIVDGNGGQRLPLDVRLAELGTLTLYAPGGGALDASDVVLTPDHDALVVKAENIGGGNWVERTLRDGLPAFPTGFGTVTIDGTWGWLDTELDPSDVTTPIGVAMRLDMEDQALAKEHGLAATVRAQARMGVSTTSEGSLTAVQTSPEITLSPEVQTILEPLIWQPPAKRV